MAGEKYGRVSTAEARAYADEVWDSCLADLAELVAVPSVSNVSAACPGAPWGAACRKALDVTLAIGRRLGLATTDGEGRLGWAELRGASPDGRHIASIAHVDVVPAGGGWDTSPFVLTRREGWLIGRGVLDDKGAALAALYAAGFFARRNEVPPVGIRCLVGASEEAGMQDVRWYRAHNEQPLFCFTPDAEFPVCCGEKGGVNARFTFELDATGVIVSLSGGTARNAVPDAAEAVVRADVRRLPAADGVTVEEAGPDLSRIRARGTGGHAAMPEGTVNAVGVLVEYLLERGICSVRERAFLELESCLLGCTDGSGLGIAAADDLFDPLTCVGTLLSTEASCVTQQIDVRFPKSITADAIGARLSAAASAHGCAAEITHVRSPYFVEPDSPEVQALLAAYSEVTGRSGQPFTIGGGTYAHHFDRAVSFGPLDASDDTPSWVGPEHGANEGVSEAALKRALAVYVLAFDRLLALYQ